MQELMSGSKLTVVALLALSAVAAHVAPATAGVAGLSTLSTASTATVAALLVSSAVAAATTSEATATAASESTTAAAVFAFGAVTRDVSDLAALVALLAGASTTEPAATRSRAAWAFARHVTSLTAVVAGLDVVVSTMSNGGSRSGVGGVPSPSQAPCTHARGDRLHRSCNMS